MTNPARENLFIKIIIKEINKIKQNVKSIHTLQRNHDEG